MDAIRMKPETHRFSFLLLALLLTVILVAQGRRDDSDASARSWCARCAQLEQAGAIDSAVNAGRRGIELARRSAPDDLPYCLNAVAGLHLAQDEYEQARAKAQEALTAARERSERLEEIKAEHMLGKLAHLQGDLTAALEYYHRALRRSKAEGAAFYSALAVGNIGIVYDQQGDTARALRHYKRSIRLYAESGQPDQARMVVKSMGGLYADAGNTGRALQLYKRSLEMSQRIRDKKFEGAAKLAIGQIYARQGRFAKATAMLRQSLAIAAARNDKYRVSAAQAEIANVHVWRGQPDSARFHAAAALRVAREIGALDRMEDAALASFRADSAAGDFAGALRHIRLYNAIQDSLYNVRQSVEIGRLETRLRYERENAERELRQRAFTFGGLAALLVLLGAAGALGYGFQVKRRANAKLEAKNDALERAGQAITDSIDYASRIQRALLPSDDAMRQNVDVYVYYKARDVVSGDFYWTHQIDKDTALYSAADCTGHGVPGAFMSVLGATTLDTIVREYGETRPDEILGLLDLGIRNALKQDENKDASLDGMDLALVKLDKRNRKLYFSSAGRPLFLLRNGEFLEYKGAKFPAGGAQHGDKAFPLIEIDLKPGDRIFMCSDGVTDQFGGPRGRKFSPRRLKETLLAHQDKSLQAQGAAFAEAFDEWQKNAKQLDDQLLIGLAV